MAHTLTFSGYVSVSVDGQSVTSPYTLTKSCTIRITNTKDTDFGIDINGTQYVFGTTTIDLADSDIVISDKLGATGRKVTVIINYSETAPRLSVDVPTLPGWANLSAGEHNITIVAKANGFKDSAPSVAVQVEKAVEAKIWGVSGLGNSDPTLTRTFDNVGKTYSINSAAGTITTDFDTEFNFETVVQDGNTMIKIPTFYKRFDTITDNQITAFSMSKTKVNDDFIPYPCFVKQDGTGEVMPYILVSKGKATGTSSKATCVSGSAPLVNVTRAQMRAAARANGLLSGNRHTKPMHLC